MGGKELGPIPCRFCSTVIVYNGERYNPGSYHDHFVHVHLKQELEKIYPSANIELEPWPDLPRRWVPDAIVLDDENNPKVLCELCVSNDKISKDFWAYAENHGCEVVLFVAFSLDKLIEHGSKTERKFQEWWKNRISELRKEHPVISMRVYREDGDGKFDEMGGF